MAVIDILTDRLIAHGAMLSHVSAALALAERYDEVSLLTDLRHLEAALGERMRTLAAAAHIDGEVSAPPIDFAGSEWDEETARNDGDVGDSNG